MCDQYINAFNKLKNDKSLSDDDKDYIRNSQIHLIKKRYYSDEFYLWKQYDGINFYRNYDSVTDNIELSRGYKYGKRKLNKEIRVSGLPSHCFDNK